MKSDSENRKGNNWEWIASNFGDKIEKIVSGSELNYPAQLEIHPHHQSTIACNNSCPGCTGLKYVPASKGNGIEPERLIHTIESVRGKVGKIAFSGNSTEPLLYPEIVKAIRKVREIGADFSLYSNFYYADREGVIDALLDSSGKDYVRASINSGTEESYFQVHRPRFDNSFQKVSDNIKKFASEKIKRKSNVYFHLTYLINNFNMSTEIIDRALEFALDNDGIDGIRFTTYQKPLGREVPKCGLIEEDKYKKTIEHIVNKKQQKLKDNFEISFFQEGLLLNQKEKPFSRCYVQDIFAVIGFDGGVYPCTAMASSSSPEYYRFGNINTEDFLDIWKNRNEKRNFPLDKCYDCTRAEFQINNYFHQIKIDRKM